MADDLIECGFCVHLRVDALAEHGSPLVATWPAFLHTLETEHQLMKTNAEYLGTIADYLTTIRQHDDFTFILSLLPNLMIGLRHIWTMSNWYCYDERMQQLLRKVSTVFTDKVKHIIDLPAIFGRSAAEAQQRALDCAHLLRTWKRAYLATRSYIESTAVGSRWEFDRTVLFSDVDHIGRIAQDIADTAGIFVQFESTFGDRLASLVDDPRAIEEQLRKAYALIGHVTNVDYDIFCSGNVENWLATLATFRRHLAVVEADAKVVLDGCVASLRSARQGLSLVNDAAAMQTMRPSLAAHLATKHEHIMKKFIGEIGIVEHEFVRYRQNPPRWRNQPECVGAVLWQRLLFEHLKRSVMAIKAVEDDPALRDSYLKRTAFSQYFALAKEMSDYEQQQFERFVASAVKVVNRQLGSNIVKLSAAVDGDGLRKKMPSVKRATKKKKADVQVRMSVVQQQQQQPRQKRLSSGSGTSLAAGRRSIGGGKLTAVTTALTWLKERPADSGDDEDVQRAQKYMDTLVITEGVTEDVEYLQAKRA